MPEVTGTVTLYNRVRCYGFIAGDDGQDYFVHRSEFAGPALQDGDRVVFDAVESPRGPRAVGVRRIGEPVSTRA